MLPLPPSAQRYATGGSIAMMLGLALYTIHTFLPPLAWAAVLTIGLWPVHQTLQKRFGLSKRSSAIILTIASTLLVLLPLGCLTYQAAIEFRPLALWLEDVSQNGVSIPDWINHVPFGQTEITNWWNQHLSSGDAVKQTYATFQKGKLLHTDQVIARGTAKLFTLLFFTILTLFFFLLSGDKLSSKILRSAKTLIGDTGETILTQTVSAIRSTIEGIILVGVGEGILIGAVYYATGLPHPALFTMATAIAAMFPFCSLLVVLIASLITTSQGTIEASIMLTYGCVVIFTSDHIIRPKLIGGTTKLPFLLVLLGILGGIETWGVIGLFIGPAFMAVALTLWSNTTQPEPEPAAQLQPLKERRRMA